MPHAGVQLERTASSHTPVDQYMRTVVLRVPGNRCRGFNIITITLVFLSPERLLSSPPSLLALLPSLTALLQANISHAQRHKGLGFRNSVRPLSNKNLGGQYRLYGPTLVFIFKGQTRNCQSNHYGTISSESEVGSPLVDVQSEGLYVLRFIISDL